VIVNYNTRDLLRECLESVYRYPTKYSFEVLVVDNHSADGSFRMVKDEFGDAKAVLMERNLGYAKANNHALREARGRFLLLLNPDTRLQPGSLDGLVDFLVEHGDAGAVGCKQLDDRMRLQLTWGKFPSFAREVVRKALHHRLAIDGTGVREYLESKYSVPADVDWVAGSCLLVRREVCHEVGLLDENIFLYFEDIDWCRRIQQARWRVCYTPRTHIIHHGGASANLHQIDAAVEYRRSQFYFTRKWFGWSGMAALKVLMAVKTLAALALWGTRHALAAPGSAARHEALCQVLVAKRTLPVLATKVPGPQDRVDHD
jgi:GT2 family glycosyltransferase